MSFRREKFVPRGGPDGGDGGKGGDVILIADPSLRTLLAFRKRHHLQASSGRDGQGSNKSGRSGEDLEVKVPVGTVVHHLLGSGEEKTEADLEYLGARVVIARGGQGGRGNARFASPVNQAPRLAEKGEPGGEGQFRLELKLLADVGIVGRPNVGKSTLLAAASRARPRIAPYPFTTLEPVLGVVELGETSFVLAEIPGLVEGAHLGVGLGHDFLRHAERTKMLIHLLDGTSPGPLADLERINRELTLFHPGLGEKPQVVAINKVDLPEVRQCVPELERALRKEGREVFSLSAATGEGVTRLLSWVGHFLDTLPVPPKKAEVSVFRPRSRQPPISVSREGEVAVVDFPAAARLVAGTDVRYRDTRRQLWHRLAKMGVVRALEKASVASGDRVRFGQVELKWE